MARTDHTAAPNAQLTSAVVYGVDQRGFSQFAQITRAATAALSTDRAVVARPSYSGWAKAPQVFRGGAALGAVRPVTVPTSTIGDQVSKTLADPIMAALFAREGS